jgi:hypothetical protein
MAAKTTTNLILEDLLIRVDELTKNQSAVIKNQENVNEEIVKRLTSIEVEITSVKKAVGFFMKLLQICSWIAGIATAVWKLTSIFIVKGGTD